MIFNSYLLKIYRLNFLYGLFKFANFAEQANERKGAFEEPRPKWTRTLVLSTNAKFIRRRDFDTAQHISLLF